MQEDVKPESPAPTTTPQKLDDVDTINEADIESTKPVKPPKKHWWSRWWGKLESKWRSLRRRNKIIVAAAAVILIAGISTGLVLALHKSPAVIPSPATIKKTAKSTTAASPLTGLQVPIPLTTRPVTAIMIENSDAARPQSGLQDAGVVFEAMAEGGVTRFMALFQDTSPQYIGPVRSLRPYYIDYAAPFQASIVHVGGSPDALSEVTNGSSRNLDQFYNGSYFTRITSRDAPHNVYTSFAELDQLNQSKGYTSSKFTSWARKADKPLAVPTAKTIDLSVSGPDYYSHYDYDSTTNSYARNEGGAPHLDYVSATDTSGVLLKPKVVIAIVVPETQGALDASGAYYSNYATSGSGVAYVFQDGGVTQGTWTKAGTTDQLLFTDANGHALKLNAGQTWVTLVTDTSQVSYAP